MPHHGRRLGPLVSVRVRCASQSLWVSVSVWVHGRGSWLFFSKSGEVEECVDGGGLWVC